VNSPISDHCTPWQSHVATKNRRPFMDGFPTKTPVVRPALLPSTGLTFTNHIPGISSSYPILEMKSPWISWFP
jgi:hypothetical protein